MESEWTRRRSAYAICWEGPVKRSDPNTSCWKRVCALRGMFKPVGFLLVSTGQFKVGATLQKYWVSSQKGETPKVSRWPPLASTPTWATISKNILLKLRTATWSRMCGVTGELLRCLSAKAFKICFIKACFFAALLPILLSRRLVLKGRLVLCRELGLS